MTMRPATRALVVEAVLATAVTALWSAAMAVPTPPLRSWTAATRWYASVGPDTAVAAAVRVGALGVAVWLMIATAAQLVVVWGAPAAVRHAADLIAPRSLQRLVHGLAGLSLSAGLAVAAPSAGTPTAEPTGVAVLHLVGEPPPSTATLRLVPDAAPPATPAPVAAAAQAAPVLQPFVVEPGDSLWSIAEEVLADEGAAAPGDAAIEGYWRRLIDANRAHLVDPSNPDLIYPGQTVQLPAV